MYFAQARDRAADGLARDVVRQRVAELEPEPPGVFDLDRDLLVATFLARPPLARDDLVAGREFRRPREVGLALDEFVRAFALDVIFRPASR